MDKASGIRCGEFSCGLAFIHTPKNGSFYINEQGDNVFSVSDKDIYNQKAMTNMRFSDNRVIDCIEKEMVRTCTKRYCMIMKERS